MSNIDLGDNPTGAAPDAGQQAQIRSALGITDPTGSQIEQALDTWLGTAWKINIPAYYAYTDPQTLQNYDYQSTVDIVFTDYFNSVTLTYAGQYNGANCYTPSGDTIAEDPYNSVDYTVLFWDTYDYRWILRVYDGSAEENRTYQNTYTGGTDTSSALFGGNFTNISHWQDIVSGEFDLFSFIIPELSVGFTPLINGQLFVNGYSNNLFLSANLGEEPEWIEVVGPNGTLEAPALGTPASGNLANCTNIPANSLSGQVAVANGGTGATDRKGASAATNPAIVDSALTAITLSSATHNGTILRCTSSSAVTITVSSDLGLGFSCDIIRAGTGTVTISGSGQTIQSYLGTKIAGQYGRATLTRVASATYNLSGNTSA